MAEESNKYEMFMLSELKADIKSIKEDINDTRKESNERLTKVEITLAVLHTKVLILVTGLTTALSIVIGLVEKRIG